MTASLTELRAAREKEAAAADLAAKEAAAKEAFAALSIKAANEAAWAQKSQRRRSARAPQLSSSASSAWEAPQAKPPERVAGGNRKVTKKFTNACWKKND